MVGKFFKWLFGPKEEKPYVNNIYMLEKVGNDEPVEVVEKEPIPDYDRCTFESKKQEKREPYRTEPNEAEELAFYIFNNLYDNINKNKSFTKDFKYSYKNECKYAKFYDTESGIVLLTDKNGDIQLMFKDIAFFICPYNWFKELWACDYDYGFVEKNQGYSPKFLFNDLPINSTALCDIKHTHQTEIINADKLKLEKIDGAIKELNTYVPLPTCKPKN